MYRCTDREKSQYIYIENPRARHQVQRIGINGTINCQSIDEEPLFTVCYIRLYHRYSWVFRALRIVCMAILHKNLMKNAWNMQHCWRRHRHLKGVNAKMGYYVNLSFFSVSSWKIDNKNESQVQRNSIVTVQISINFLFVYETYSISFLLSVLNFAQMYKIIMRTFIFIYILV